MQCTVSMELLGEADRKEFHQIFAANLARDRAAAQSDFSIRRRTAEPGVDAKSPSTLPGPANCDGIS